MRTELERVVADADLGLLWELASERPSDVNGRMMSVSLQGRCLATRPEGRERGPLGWTKTANGQEAEVQRQILDAFERALDPIESSDGFGCFRALRGRFGKIFVKLLTVRGAGRNTR
jgi:hypothetical protein